MPCNSDAAAAAGIPRPAARVPPHGRKRSKHPKTIRTMNYVELNIAASGEEAEILTALLADWPFESFSEEGGALRAYIPQEKLADCKSEVDALLDARGALRRTYLTIDDCNWNAAWESDFQPVDIDGRLLIRAPFHAPAADASAEVVIMPRMSFGTGHHATTYLMTEALLELDLRGRRGLDAGSGTGVLAIAAAKCCGAAAVDAVDIDEWAEASCRENAAANGVADRVRPLRGDVGCASGGPDDFILANISRNILTACMPRFAAMLAPGGDLLLSGFLDRDEQTVREAAEAAGVRPVRAARREGWTVLHCRREA